MNQSASSMTSHIRVITRMNPPMFFGSKVNEDPQDFIDAVYKILYAMGMSSKEKNEIAAYQLIDVVQT